MVDINIDFYKQTGIMAFRKDFLTTFTHTYQPGPLEMRESIDMIRILENDGQLQGIVRTTVPPSRPRRSFFRYWHD